MGLVDAELVANSSTARQLCKLINRNILFLCFC